MTSPVSEAVSGPLGPEASRALGERLGDPAWLAALRADAAHLAAERPLPTTTERPWKYLDIAGSNFDPFKPGLDAATRYTAAEARDAFGLPEKLAALAVVSNSETVLAESYEPGVTVSGFEAADQDLLAANVGKAVPAGRNKLTGLHYAFLRGGVVVTAARNTEAAAPVRIVRHFEEGRQLGTPHTLIVTEPNSRVTVVEDCRSVDGPILVLPTAEIFPGQGSTVTYVVLHRWGAQTRVLGEQQVITGQDSTFVGFQAVLGGRTIKEHLFSSIEGRGSASELYGFAVGDMQQHSDFYTVQDHVGPDTRSDLLIKSALYERSRAVYYGLTRVGLGAKNADANQENRNLLLSKQAAADSDPVLEILTSDVIKVSHGATAGPVDDEQLYYLETRGIPRKVAESMLVNGYLGEVIARVADEGVRDELAELLEQKLAKVS